MNKVRKQFVIYAVTAIFVLLAVLLAIINCVNFSLAAKDADGITQTIAENHGILGRTGRYGGESGFNQWRPSQSDTAASVRYFTFAFDNDGNAERIAFEMSSVNENDAKDWAESLKNGGTGWTKTAYRYRVYRFDNKTYVSVIDCGRELVGVYRILLISLIGGAVGLLISFAALMAVSKRIFKPIEEADRKQKQFIANIEHDFKLPLTVINANTEVIERESGASEQTQSINRQVKKMTMLVKDISSLSLYGEDEKMESVINISNIFGAAIDKSAAAFAKKGIAVKCDIAQGVTQNGDDETYKRVFEQLIDNALKFALTSAEFSLSSEGGRVTVKASNDTALPSGSCDQVFDRFTRLPNAEGIPGNGLGLSFVKEAVKGYNGRVSANVENGRFTVKIRI